MALVDYGSTDSDSDIHTGGARYVTTGKRKAGKKIVLDLPPTSHKDFNGGDEPSRKRLKHTSSRALSGLTDLLPIPKAAQPKLPSRFSALTPASVDSVAGHASPKATLSDNPFIESSGNLGTSTADIDDFFGLASHAAVYETAVETLPSSTTTTAAPMTSEKSDFGSAANHYATLPAPTATNPFPGFHSVPSGQWVADKPAEWAAWCAANGMSLTGQKLQFPDAQEKALISVIGAGTNVGGEAYTKLPSKIVEAKEIPEKAIIMGGRGGNKHQLSSLLYQAHANRAELEDRIAQSKANRKTGGARYGF